ncbi:unnamed protein product [Symbiodinium natans]|uniref:Uncharacterized protein n=1 Tax=Symbiodinium natans TaxID=878477 RepID=A0A812SKR0_9DINO|nr:unnamed protein product [Symbiodinium natans]
MPRSRSPREDRRTRPQRRPRLPHSYAELCHAIGRPLPQAAPARLVVEMESEASPKAPRHASLDSDEETILAESEDDLGFVTLEISIPRAKLEDPHRKMSFDSSQSEAQASQSTLEISREDFPSADLLGEAACAEFASCLKEDSAVLPSAAEPGLQPASPKIHDDDGFGTEFGVSPQKGEGNSACKMIGEDPVSKLRDEDTHGDCAMNLACESSEFPCEASMKVEAPTQVGEVSGCFGACVAWLRKSLRRLARDAQSSQAAYKFSCC